MVFQLGGGRAFCPPGNTYVAYLSTTHGAGFTLCLSMLNVKHRSCNFANTNFFVGFTKGSGSLAKPIDAEFFPQKFLQCIFSSQPYPTALDLYKSFSISSVAMGGGGGGGATAPPPLACRPKCRIRKIPRFSTSQTLFCTGLD